MTTPENKIIYEFWKDSAMRDAVHEYLINYLKEEALVRLFDENDEKYPYGFAEAKMVIDKSFESMDNLFEPKPKITGTQSPR